MLVCASSSAMIHVSNIVPRVFSFSDMVATLENDRTLETRLAEALVNIRRKALSPLMIFTQGRTVFCFYITLR